MTTAAAPLSVAYAVIIYNTCNVCYGFVSLVGGRSSSSSSAATTYGANTCAMSSNAATYMYVMCACKLEPSVVVCWRVCASAHCEESIRTCLVSPTRLSTKRRRRRQSLHKYDDELVASLSRSIQTHTGWGGWWWWYIRDFLCMRAQIENVFNNPLVYIRFTRICIISIIINNVIIIGFEVWCVALSNMFG